MLVVVSTEERGDMMLVVVPTMVLTSSEKYLPGYCFPSLIWKLTNLTSEVCKGLLEGVQ